MNIKVIKPMTNNGIFDLVVIGGGPAGMMAAGIAASRGAKVLLLEKNKALGKKLLISGNGRCNITQSEFNLRKLVSTYGENGTFLFSALNRFDPRQVMDFFEDLGMKLKIEKDGRVFPASNSSQEILDKLKQYLLQRQVKVRYESTIKDIEVNNNIVRAVILNDENRIETKNLLIATGGLSYPATGSTGDALKWLKRIGIQASPTKPALVPLKVKEPWAKDLQGLSLQNVEITVYQDNKKIASRVGDMLFAHFGISGPVVLNISRDIIHAWKGGEMKMRISFFPALNQGEVDKKVQADFNLAGRKLLKKYLSELVSKRMTDRLIEVFEFNGDKKLSEVTREERLRFSKLMSGLELTIIGDMGYNQAIVTSGGVSLKEIDPQTMSSKKISNLYFAGEVLDLDGPTGGYNLQIAWTTGHLVGDSIKF